MAGKTILDAMIRRADFQLQAEASALELNQTLNIDQIAGASPIARLMRKPDFQRETNHWSPSQVAALVNSFARFELIPALILWKSSSFVFVIDGAHRISALKAWVLNDYGDGPASLEFFGREITNEQKKKANETRRLVEKAVGRYADFEKMQINDDNSSTDLAKLTSTIFSRTLTVQWIQGSSDVAESSFFKINSQGTILDDVEEMLLKNRKKCYAIAARAIVRSGLGHKYWSDFDPQVQKEIEELATKLNVFLFHPEISMPIKTIDLPLGGTVSPVDALKMLVDLFSVLEGEVDSSKKIKEIDNDLDGRETVALMRQAFKKISRITGNESGSLGLHPAVYFYTEQGKQSRFLFLGTVLAIAKHVDDNNKVWFQKFTRARESIEGLLVAGKEFVNQGLANVGSRQRIERVRDLIDGLVIAHHQGKDLSLELVKELLGLKGTLGDLRSVDYMKSFDSTAKSAIFLKQALLTAPVCPVCKGRISPTQAMQYDHVIPLSKGGDGHPSNGQILHPFCNQSIKEDKLTS